jgi:hypothetical protein
MRLLGRIADGCHAKDRFGKDDELVVAKKLSGTGRLECRDRLIDRKSPMQLRPHRYLPENTPKSSVT